MKKNNKKKFLVANWKMNKSYNNSLSYIKTLENHYNNDIVLANNNNITISIAPSFPFLESICKHSNNIKIAAQDCAEHDSGSFTGEVSAYMIRSIGAHYVILGHSERRKYFLETNDIISEKMAQAILNSLIPIFCCGEPLEMRETDNHLDYVIKQVESTINNVVKKIKSIDKPASKQNILFFFKNLIIAYEPIWAIGTNKIPTTKEIQNMHVGIKKCLKDIMKTLDICTIDYNSSKFDKKVSHNKRGHTLMMNNLDITDIPVIYGGNLNSNNASSILQCDNVDGGLVGRASLDIEDFVSILKSFLCIL